MKSNSDLWRDRVLAWLGQNVSSHRLNHILGVEQTCIKLAKHHQYSPKKAAKAGLLHDLAKFFPAKKLLAISKQNKLEIDPICQKHPHLIHADVSAIIAQQEFGIENPKILNAIKNHTLGNPKMDKLSCIVYIADAIEPNRGDTPELNRLREIAQENLYLGVWETSDYGLQYLIRDRKVIHPRTILTRNWALKKARVE